MEQKEDSKAGLFAALSKAQGEFKTIPFDSRNPHFGNEFASLAAHEDAVRKILASHGLSLVHTVHRDDAKLSLKTTLCHSSGATIEGDMPLILGKQDMQGLGSAITYAKRYALSAMLSISDGKDDDAEAAVGRQKSAQSLPEKKPLDFTENYQVNFGKFTGKTLGQIGVHNAVNYADYLKKSVERDGKQMSKSVSEFCSMVAQWQNELAEKASLDGPPNFDKNEEIPF